jgi:hypothetical protein
VPPSPQSTILKVAWFSMLEVRGGDLIRGREEGRWEYEVEREERESRC